MLREVVVVETVCVCRNVVMSEVEVRERPDLLGGHQSDNCIRVKQKKHPGSDPRIPPVYPTIVLVIF